MVAVRKFNERMPIESTLTFGPVFRRAGSTMCLLAVAALATSALAAAPDRSPSWADRDLFPEAYSILTSDRVMFPDDVSDWPLKIDATHQLFVDDYLISRIEHLSRQFHQPTKHPGNPLLPGGYLGVLYDERKGQFRMWNNLDYFTSGDGVKWIRLDPGPDGDLLRKEGGQLRGFIYHPDLPKSADRYKAVVERRFNEQAGEPGGFYLYHSPDGLKWERRPQRAILQRSANCMFPCEFRPVGVGEPRQLQWGVPDHMQANGVGDTSTFRYDPVLKRYVFDGKLILHFPPEKVAQLGIVPEPRKYPHLRLRTFSESEDLLHWSPPRFLMYPDRLDAPDCQIYAHVGFVYESMWIGLIQRMKHQETSWKQTDLTLSYSRDGRQWLRPQNREPFIPLGAADSWEADYAVSSYTAPVLKGEELYFYYSSTRNPARYGKTPNEPWPPQQIGLARLRRDGFCSLNAGDTPGQIVTRPLTFRGTSLFVNVEIPDGGWIQAGVLTRDSKAIAGYELENSVPLTRDTTRGRMVWKSRTTLNPAGDGHLRIVFQLRNAKCYSFWIE